MNAVAVVGLDELVALFTGVPDDQGGWATTPAYNIRLVVEIARRTDPQTLQNLRWHLYDDSPIDDIPSAALEAIRLGFERYRSRQEIARSRGL